MTANLRDDLGYLGSRYYAMSLIQYPNGNPRANDIDFVSYKNNFCLFGECKMFIHGKNEMYIDSTKFNMMKLLANKIEKTSRKIILVGTDSYGLVSPDDRLWYTTLDSVLLGETPSLTPGQNIIIQKDDMIQSTRRAFSELGNRLLDHYGCTTPPTTSHSTYAYA